jgi:hypothetical protein
MVTVLSLLKELKLEVEEGRGRSAEESTSSKEQGEKLPFPRKKDNESDEENVPACSLSLTIS